MQDNVDRDYLSHLGRTIIEKLAQVNRAHLIMRTFLLSGTILLAATASVLAEDATGEWLVEDKSARIKIVNCQNALWGVMWAEKSPGFDTGNRDPSMKGRPMLGIPILINLKPTEANSWAGKVYDPKGSTFMAAGGIYDVKIKLAKKDTLEVRGCMMGICDGEDWSRIINPNTPPIPPSQAAAPSVGGAKGSAMAPPPASGAKGSAMAPQGGAMAPQGGAMAPAPKGNTMAKAAPGAPAGAAPQDPICTSVASMVPRT
ncbi:MAG: DUF2147 domain-containing protein [Proteobacteria bacterium]|nr:MAG: DUF2147 domain-containing protein [Pseudomonadota bacterium]